RFNSATKRLARPRSGKIAIRAVVSALIVIAGLLAEKVVNEGRSPLPHGGKPATGVPFLRCSPFQTGRPAAQKLHHLPGMGPRNVPTVSEEDATMDQVAKGMTQAGRQAQGYFGNVPEEKDEGITDKAKDLAKQVVRKVGEGMKSAGDKIK